MKPLLAGLLAGLLTALPAHGFTHVTGSLDGAQPVPPTGSPGSGVAHCLVDTDTNTLYYHIDFSGLGGTETVAHIHGPAAAGATAGVLHGLPLGSPKIGVWAYPEAQEVNILGGLTYVNVHSSTFPGGEIRAQLEVNSDTDLVCLIEQSQTVPPTGSAGQGIGVFNVDTGANTVDYDIRFGNLGSAEIASHIHGFAAPGAIAGVLHPLPTGSPKIGTWSYAEASEANILAELAYVNIHTVNFGGGEVRGQMIGVDGGAVGAPLVGTAAGASRVTVSPNPVPAGASTALFFSRAQEGPVSLQIHDVSGRLVRTLESNSGRNGMIAWDARNQSGEPVPAGVYFVRLLADEPVDAARVIVLR